MCVCVRARAKQAFVAFVAASEVSGHGWVTSPVSKNEMAYHHYEYAHACARARAHAHAHARMHARYSMPDDFRYEPQTCNIGNGIGNMVMTGGATCGGKNASSSKGLHLWQQWYDSRQVPVPRLVPGSDVVFNITLTIDHGGQAWMMLACAEDVEEGNDWLILPRAKSDRTSHFMPSAPGAIAWAPLEFEKTKANKFSTVGRHALEMR